MGRFQSLTRVVSYLKCSMTTSGRPEKKEIADIISAVCQTLGVQPNFSNETGDEKMKREYAALVSSSLPVCLETTNEAFEQHQKLVKRGWLVKRGHFIKNWKRRWFVLDEDRIQYYKVIPETATEPIEPQGSILLEDCFVEDAKGRFKSHPYCFKITTTNEKKPHFYVQGSSPSESVEWMDAIKRTRSRLFMQQYREKTKFAGVDARIIYNVYMRQCDGKSRSLDRKMFHSGLSEIFGPNDPLLVNPALAERLFDLLDVNGDGVLDLSEFISGIALLAGGSKEHKLKVVFDAYDLDGSGYLTKDEVSHALRASWNAAARGSEASFDDVVVSKAVDSMFELVDKDKDGKVTLEELKNWIDLEKQCHDLLLMI